MPGKPETEQIQFQSSIYSQPWWRGVAENASKSSSSVDQQNGSVMNGVTVAQSGIGEGPADGVGSNKQRQPMVSPSLSGTDNSGGDVTEENENIKNGLSSIPFTMGTLGPNSQMELVGHSIVLTSHPYFDAQYGGILTTYGQQTMTNPQLYGMHRARMPLPLEMEEEPVYVNAKQYHGILRRRQSRAKAELEKKVIKVRKPYLHESRHLHAMRRARGNGGRFLNTKKLEGNNPNATTEEGNNNNNGSNPSAVSGSKLASARLHTDNALQDLTIGYLDGNGLSSLYHSPSNGRNEGQCFGGERHGAPNGAIE